MISRKKSKKSQNPLVLERSLGFWFKQGISRPTKTDKPFIGPPLNDLNLRIKRLNKTWGFESTETIRNAAGLTAEITCIFDQLAPSLWPDQPARRQALWLVDAQGTTHNGLYPKDLFASDPDDRRTLLEIFTLLIRAKLIKKKLNNDRDARERPLQADLYDGPVSGTRRNRPRLREGSRSVSPGFTSELTEFTESDSEIDDDMTAPQADMYNARSVTVPPPANPAADHETQDNSNARHSQSRTSDANTPQSDAYKMDMTPESSVPRSRRRESTDDASPKKRPKNNGFDPSGSGAFQPAFIAHNPPSQPRHSGARPESSRSSAHPTANPLPTPRSSSSFPASRKGSRLPARDFPTPATTAADDDENDKANVDKRAPTSAPPSTATLLKDVRCFFDMSTLTSFRGMSCTPLLAIPDARSLFADIDRLSALTPAATPPARAAVGVVIDVFEPRGADGVDAALAKTGLAYSPYIDRQTHTQSTFPLFVEDLAEWVAAGEVSPKLWLLMSVQWS